MVKYLADEGFPRPATERLRLLGWDVWELTVRAPQLCGTDDVEKVLLYAKRIGRVLLSGDMFEDRPTRVRMHDNIRQTKRGRTLSVSGAVSNHRTVTVGKLLIHQLRIEGFFEAGHGMAKIEDGRNDGLKTMSPNEIPRVAHVPVNQGDKYLHRAKQLPLIKAKPPKQPKASAPLREIE